MTTPGEISPRKPANWWRSIGSVPGVLLALLPKAACLLRVAAYAGAMSSLGHSPEIGAESKEETNGQAND